MTNIFYRMSPTDNASDVKETPSLQEGNNIFFRMEPEWKRKETNIPQQIALGAIETGLGGLGTLREQSPRSLPGQEARYLREQQSPEALIAESADIGEAPEYFTQKAIIPKILPTEEQVREHITHRPEPQTPSQRIGLAAGKGLVGGTAVGVGSAAIQGLQELGAPEWLTNALQLGLIPLGAYQIGKEPLGPKIEARTPSGLPIRKYEKLEKPTHVRPELKENIINTVTKDVSNAAEELLKENDIRKAMQEHADIKPIMQKAFQAVRHAAAQDTTPINTSLVTSNFKEIASPKMRQQYMKPEYQQAYEYWFNESLKHMPEVNMTRSELLDVFRNTNSEYGDLIEVGKSNASNKAKRSVWLDRNKAILKTFEEQFPDDPFVPMMKKVNEVNTKIERIRTIDDFIDNVASKGLNKKVIQEYFDNPEVSKAIDHVYGDEVEKEMSLLMKDAHSKAVSFEKLSGKPKEKLGTVGRVAKYTLHPTEFIKDSTSLFKAFKDEGLIDPIKIRQTRKKLEPTPGKKPTYGSAPKEQLMIE